MKLRLGKYLKENYREILKKNKYADALELHDLFLVTGTYITKNWEAAVFATDTSSGEEELCVKATRLANGYFSIDWESCILHNGGFDTGHTHLGQDLPNPDSVSSFGACCPCDQTPKNQCIFLRGWRIKEMVRFSKSSLVIPISVENVTNVEWRRAQIIWEKSKSFEGSLAPASGSWSTLIPEASEDCELSIIGESGEVLETSDLVNAFHRLISLLEHSLCISQTFMTSCQSQCFRYVSFSEYHRN